MSSKLCPPGKEIITGPRGGTYYLNTSGNKVYCTPPKTKLESPAKTPVTTVSKPISKVVPKATLTPVPRSPPKTILKPLSKPVPKTILKPLSKPVPRSPPKVLTKPEKLAVKIPAIDVDSIRQVALRLPYDDIIKMCQSKQMNTIICNNIYFWRQIARKKLISNEEILLKLDLKTLKHDIAAYDRNRNTHYQEWPGVYTDNYLDYDILIKDYIRSEDDGPVIFDLALTHDYEHGLQLIEKLAPFVDYSNVRSVEEMKPVIHRLAVKGHDDLIDTIISYIPLVKKASLDYIPPEEAQHDFITSALEGAIEGNQAKLVDKYLPMTNYEQRDGLVKRFYISYGELASRKYPLIKKVRDYKE